MSNSAKSFLPLAREEIARHKWIESEKAGRDLGQSAINDWIARYWYRFCRQRRLEHVEGKCQWDEFPQEDFGILLKVRDDRKLLDELLRRLNYNQANLEILMWSLDAYPLKIERIQEFLLLININRARLPESHIRTDAGPYMDLAQLRERVANGESFEYLYFWSHRPSKDGSITHSCLSQWYPASFTIDGITYPTAEHWMMASKARLFRDDAVLKQILETTDPRQAKALGRTVSNFDNAVWETNACRLVVEGNVAKFGQNESLKSFLLGTGKRILVEASPDDRIWGIGLVATDEKAKSPATWQGQNMLGFALMNVRAQLAG